MLTSLLLVLYPAVVYYGLSHGMAWLGLLLLILYCVYQVILLEEKRWQIIALILLLALGTWFQQAATIKLIPLLIHLSLLLLFYQSLRQTPLIEQFARLDFPDFPAGMAKHCLQMTQIWVVFFAFNIVLNTLLVGWATDAVWALYNGMLVYILIGALVLGEYIWRRMKFPNLDMPSLQATARNIAKHSRHIIGQKSE